MLLLLEKFFKLLFVSSLLCTLILFFIKDVLPPASYYDMEYLPDPVQKPTREKVFITEVNGQEYHITPKYDYELYGVIVSYHNSDAFGDIWHLKDWKDFINLRDLCVIWGRNVQSGVYLDMDFRNDSWACWVYWPDSQVRNRFSMTQLSNNHILIDDEKVKSSLMSSEPGDHIYLKGMLVEYRNPANGFYRKTSTTRSDTGNGACETIYVTDFDIIDKANSGVRAFYTISKWTAITSLLGFLIMFVVTPYKGGFSKSS